MRTHDIRYTESGAQVNPRVVENVRNVIQSDPRGCPNKPCGRSWATVGALLAPHDTQGDATNSSCTTFSELWTHSGAPSGAQENPRDAKNVRIVVKSDPRGCPKRSQKRALSNLAELSKFDDTTMVLMVFYSPGWPRGPPTSRQKTATTPKRRLWVRLDPGNGRPEGLWVGLGPGKGRPKGRHPNIALRLTQAPGSQEPGYI